MGGFILGQAKVEQQLKPLQAALDAIAARLGKGGKVPSFGSLTEWAQVPSANTLAI